MKRLWLVVSVIICLGLVVFAQMSDEEQATQFFEDINAAPYSDWAFEPGVPEGFYIGQAPHGRILRSYVNETAMSAVGSGGEAFPEGSIFVKENHLPGDIDVDSMEPKAAVEGFEGDLADLTFMVKVPGYNPDAGDWFWAKMPPDGSITAAGTPDGCIGCHGQVADNDYVFDASLATE